MKTITTTLLSLLLLLTPLTPLATASATIGSLTAPSQASAGSTIKATLGTSIYIQNWEDYSIIWGLTTPKAVGSSTVAIGQQIGYTQLYGTDTEKLNNFTVEVTIPDDFTPGDWALIAAVPYLVGASGSMGIHAFNSSIKITA
ncbi:hypothetical protein GGS20DRAFT_556724 [Poronia punctata]|nr:hypothetical protein GGS20DRAFT_556724 [Poronia punctata]